MSDAPDLQAITQVQQQTWSKGDFAMVASLVYYVSEGLAEALEIVPDERVLDVACGSGNGAIAAARRSWGGVVGADYVPALLERGRERAAAERLDVEFVEADAQALPFEDASFDVAMSIFGEMFAPDQEKTAAELLRVVKPAQAYFLISCGLAVLVSSGDPTATLSKLKATSAVHRLISPSEMGELFKVLVLRR